MTYEINYSEIAYRLDRALEILPDIKDLFDPEDDQELANLIIKTERALNEAMNYAIGEVEA